MPEILIGIGVLLLVLWVINGLSKANAKGLAQGARLGRGSGEGERARLARA